MSTFTLVCGRASNSAQLHWAIAVLRSQSEKFQLSRSVWGVGPADSTGKSLARCWPGGIRSLRVSDLRPRKPRDIVGRVITSFFLALSQMNSTPKERNLDCRRVVCVPLTQTH